MNYRINGHSVIDIFKITLIIFRELGSILSTRIIIILWSISILHLLYAFFVNTLVIPFLMIMFSPISCSWLYIFSLLNNFPLFSSVNINHDGKEHIISCNVHSFFYAYWIWVLYLSPCIFGFVCHVAIQKNLLTNLRRDVLGGDKSSNATSYVLLHVWWEKFSKISWQRTGIQLVW
jgi:hypothetical protein